MKKTSRDSCFCQVACALIRARGPSSVETQIFFLVKITKSVPFHFTQLEGQSDEEVWMDEKPYMESYMTRKGSCLTIYKCLCWIHRWHKSRRPWHHRTHNPWIYFITCCVEWMAHSNSMITKEYSLKSPVTYIPKMTMFFSHKKSPWVP